MESPQNTSPSKVVKRVLTATLVVIVAALLLTYGRWEWLSNRYGTEMERVAVIQFEAAALPITTIVMADDIAQLKVFSRSETSAELFVEDLQGNKWLMGLQRTADGSSWTAHYDGDWQITLIHSTMGGPARRIWYWY